MTEQEAIKNIKALNAVCWQKDFYDEEFAKALALAIKALEKQSMVNEILHELKEYSLIGTVEEFKALKEKNEPMKVNVCIEEFSVFGVYGEFEIFYCPLCGARMGAVDEDEKPAQKYCINCGQKLDWELGEWKWKD